MKKILSIFALIFVFVMLFTSVSVVCYAAVSPEATVYDDDLNGKTTGKGGNLLTTSNTTSSGDVTGTTAVHTTTARTARVTTTYSSKTTKSSSVRTTKTTKNYLTNAGKDDPSSPNYTGTKKAVKDNSSKGPDMSAESNYGMIIAVAFVLISAAGVTVVKTRKKEEN